MRIAKFLTAGGLIIFLLAAGFIVSLRSCLSAYDERFALPPVLYFEKNGKKILFSLVQYNKTTSYSAEQGMVIKTFNNYYFIQTNNVATGEKIMEYQIKERVDKKSVVAKIIGATNNKAWLYVDGLVAYDPFTLKKTVDEKLIEERNPLLKGKLPVEIQYYHFNTEDKSIHFTAKDGSLWQLNTELLSVSADESPETIAANIVQKAMQLKMQSLNQTGISFNNMSVNQDTMGGRWFGLYAKAEISKLDESISFTTVYAQDVRRQLYAATADQKNGSFFINKPAVQNITPTEYFLDAGFLLDKETASIIRITNPGSHLIIYKNQVGPGAEIMLCRISNNGKLIWTINTGLASWKDWAYHDNHVLIMGNNNPNQSTGCNVLMVVDLPAGKINYYDYFSDKASNNIDSINSKNK